MPERNYFPKIKQARTAMQARAYELLKLYIANVKAARRAGKFELVAESLQWMMEHMPPDEDGIMMLESGIDRVKQVEGQKGPQINIGFALGGVNQPKQIEAKVIEIDPAPDTDKP